MSGTHCSPPHSLHIVGCGWQKSPPQRQQCASQAWMDKEMGYHPIKKSIFLIFNQRFSKIAFSSNRYFSVFPDFIAEITRIATSRDSSSSDLRLKTASDSLRNRDKEAQPPSPSMSISNETPRILAILYKIATVGGFFPLSIREIVSHEHPTRSASCPWVSPLPARAARTFNPMLC